MDALCGAAVETGERFVVEGAWSGAFAGAGFAHARTFFGTGLIVEGDSVVLAPSRALVDRIFVARCGGCHLASNSLLILLEATRGRLLRGHPYRAETFTILRGVREYEPRLPVAGPVDEFLQLFYFPARIGATDPERLEVEPTPRFEGFADYRSFVARELAALLENAGAGERRAAFRTRLTLSRGYDSPAVAALLAEQGSGTAYTAPRGNSLVPRWIDREASDDDGSAIAAALGLPVRRLSFAGRLDERLFLAAGTGDPELAFESVLEEAAHEDAPTLLLTGYHGDKVWDRRPPAYALGDDLRRGDTSGMALGEVRLHAGVVNVPVPFIGARAIASIAEISGSAEMAPWSVGGDYDRPIPRRIVEEAGIPREWFGRRKRAVVQTYTRPATPGLRRSFRRWLRHEEGTGGAVYRVRALASGARWAALRAGQAALAAAGARLAEPSRWHWSVGGEPASLLHRWAVDTLQEEGLAWSSEVREFVSSASDPPS